MGQSTDIHKFKWDELVNAYMEAGVENKELLIRILESCGIHVGEYYIVLSVDAWEENCPYSMLLSLLDKYAPIKDWKECSNDASKIFFKYQKWVDFEDYYTIEDQICKEFKLKVKEET